MNWLVVSHAACAFAVSHSRNKHDLAEPLLLVDSDQIEKLTFFKFDIAFLMLSRARKTVSDDHLLVRIFLLGRSVNFQFPAELLTAFLNIGEILRQASSSIDMNSIDRRIAGSCQVRRHN